MTSTPAPISRWSSRSTRRQKKDDRWQMAEVRRQRKEGERLGRSEGEKKTAIPGPDRICKGCAYTLVLIKHYDLVVYYQSSRALRGVGSTSPLPARRLMGIGLQAGREARAGRTRITYLPLAFNLYPFAYFHYEP